MPTGPVDVRFQGKTGSSRPTTKMTRLTHFGSRLPRGAQQKMWRAEVFIFVITANFTRCGLCDLPRDGLMICYARYESS
jgi:hypothetical protein